MAKDPYRWGSRVYDVLIEPFLVPIREKTSAVVSARNRSRRSPAVLEIACGTGNQARRIARKGISVVALDRSPAMLDQAGRKHPGPGGGRLHLVVGNAAGLPFDDGRFQVILAQLALHEMPSKIRTAALEEMHRVAESGAEILAADFLPVDGIHWQSLALTVVEFAAGKSHFRNGRLFLKQGGIAAALAGTGFDVLETWTFFGGTIGLVRARKP